MDVIMHNSPVAKHTFDIICATHPAQPGTYMCWPTEGFTSVYVENVILWAVMEHGWLAPVTMDGAWGGGDHGAENKFVLHPDGRCQGNGGDTWHSVDRALAFFKEHRPGRNANADGSPSNGAA